MTDNATLEKLQDLLAAIEKFPDPRRATTEWKQAFALLQKCPLPKDRVNYVVGMRDVAGLRGFIDQLQAPAPAEPAVAIDPDILRQAMQAFKRRVRFTQLDEESQINSHSPLSKGEDRKPNRAITPPVEFGDDVWQELTRQGKLIRLSHGFYELPKEGQ